MTPSLAFQSTNFGQMTSASFWLPALLRAVDTCVAEILVMTTRLVTGSRAEWRSCKPGEGVRIYYANHTSHLDFLLVWSSLPRRVRQQARPVAARDYWTQNMLRRYLAEHVFKCVLVDRKHTDPWVNPVAPLLDALDLGESLIVFPEGTRGSGEALQSFRAGLFHVAADRPQIELVPVWVENASRVMPKGAWIPLPVLCTSTFGASTRLQTGEEKPAFLERLREHLLKVRQP